MLSRTCELELALTLPPSSSSDPAYFRPSSSHKNVENWILRLSNLKRLYVLVIRYFECVALRLPSCPKCHF